MAMEAYLILPRSPEQEAQIQMQFSVIPRTRNSSLYFSYSLFEYTLYKIFPIVIEDTSFDGNNITEYLVELQLIGELYLTCWIAIS